MRQCKSTKLLKKLFYFNFYSNLIKAEPIARCWASIVCSRGRQPTARRPHLARQAISQKLHVLHIDFAMIHSEGKLTLSCIKIRPVTSLGHQGGRRVFWEGPKILKLCPRHFSRWGEIFLGGASLPCLRTW